MNYTEFIEELAKAFGDEFTITLWELHESEDVGPYWGYLWMTLHPRDKEGNVSELAERAIALGDPVAVKHGLTSFDVLDDEGDGSQGSFDLETWIPNGR